MWYSAPHSRRRPPPPALNQASDGRRQGRRKAAIEQPPQGTHALRTNADVPPSSYLVVWLRE